MCGSCEWRQHGSKEVARKRSCDIWDKKRVHFKTKNKTPDCNLGVLRNQGAPAEPGERAACQERQEDRHAGHQAALGWPTRPP